MNEEDKVREVLGRMSSDYAENYKIIRKEFKKMGRLEEDEYLFMLTGNLYEEIYCIIAIESLLVFGGVNPNVAGFVGNNNFVQNAINAGYSTKFIIDLIKAAKHPKVKEKLNINYTNLDGSTMLHLAISNGKNLNIAEIYELLTMYGFNSLIKDNSGKNVAELMISEHDTYGTYTYEEVLAVTNIFEREVSNLHQKHKNDISDLIRSAIKKMTGDFQKDSAIIKKICNGSNNITYNDFLYELSKDAHDENRVCYAVKALMDLGANANYVKDNANNFIQNMLWEGYSEYCIDKILDIVFNLDYGVNSLNVDYANREGETILHSAIKSSKYNGDIATLYKRLVVEGFDSRILDKENKNLIDVFQEEGERFSSGEFERFKEEYESQIAVLNGEKIDSKEKKESEEDKIIKELEVYGKVLTSKDYFSEPVVGREREVKALIVALAQDKKSPIIVGESGVGKSALVDELAYLIKNDKVPKFLKDRIIYEVTPSELVAGCKYVGQFEEKLNRVFSLAQKHNALVFIDEIHTIYGVGTSEHKSAGLEDYIKYVMDRDDMKIIGTTTEREYQEFFAADALKRRFEKIVIKEPEEAILIEIINKVIDDYCLKSGLCFENESDKDDIVDVLVEATNKSHRIFDDAINNPDLSISIIDKAFAFAKYHENEYIDKKCFADSFEYCDRIYESTRNKAKAVLNQENNKKRKSARILEVDFSKFRR